jgi:hypothetical protein
VCRFLLGESEDLGQSADKNDLAVAALPARVDFNSINERADDIYSLRAHCLVVQRFLQFGNLSAVDVWKIRMDRDLRVALLSLQFGLDLAFVSLQTS